MYVYGWNSSSGVWTEMNSSIVVDSCAREVQQWNRGEKYFQTTNCKREEVLWMYCTYVQARTDYHDSWFDMSLHLHKGRYLFEQSYQLVNLLSLYPRYQSKPSSTSCTRTSENFCSSAKIFCFVHFKSFTACLQWYLLGRNSISMPWAYRA